MTGMYFIGIVFAVIGMLVSMRLKSRFKEYAQIPASSGKSGKEIAEKMLKDHGIYDVQVISVEGQLTDHYNPLEKTVNLSRNVYEGRNAAAAAVAAHECGHAVQHATAYSMLELRSKLVPVVNIASGMVQWVILAGIFTINTFPSLLTFGVLLFGVITLFSVITLPVEFDASRRALVWLENSRLVDAEEHSRAKNALNWAASTYVVSALSAIANLLYLISYLNRRD